MIIENDDTEKHLFDKWSLFQSLLVNVDNCIPA